MTTIYLIRSKTEKDAEGHPRWWHSLDGTWVPIDGYIADVFSTHEPDDWALPDGGEWVRFESRPASIHKADPIPDNDQITKELRLEEVKALADALQDTFAKNEPKEPEPGYVDGEWHLFVRTEHWSGTIFGSLSGTWFYLWTHPGGIRKSGSWYKHELLHLTPEQGLQVLKILTENR